MSLCDIACNGQDLKAAHNAISHLGNTAKWVNIAKWESTSQNESTLQNEHMRYNMHWARCEGCTPRHYVVATIGRLLTIIGLLCRIQSLLYGFFAKETDNLKEPTNCSHPIWHLGNISQVAKQYMTHTEQDLSAPPVQTVPHIDILQNVLTSQNEHIKGTGQDLRAVSRNNNAPPAPFLYLGVLRGHGLASRGF